MDRQTLTNTPPSAQNTSDASFHAQRTHARAKARAQTAATALGVFSLAIGAVELLLPRRLARATGMSAPSPLLVACGLREIGTGIGLLTARNKTPWLWARVACDAIDLAALAHGARRNDGHRGRALVSIAAVAGVALADAAALRKTQQQASQRKRASFDYSDRVGLALSPDEMRGQARPPGGPGNAPGSGRAGSGFALGASEANGLG
jgi:hypothetical protein